MGLLDIVSSMFGNQGNDKSSMLLNLVMGLINDNGGLQGLVSRLRSSGLGAQADSWVSKGENLPINADQLQSFLGSDKLQAMAAQLGLGHQETADGLAAFLPKAVDHLTPDGEVPQNNFDVMSVLKGLLK